MPRVFQSCTVLALLLLATPLLAQAPRDSARAILRARFERELRRIAEDYDGVLGAQFVDLTDGTRAGVNERLVFAQGSAIKIPILLQLFRAEEARPGLLRERQTVGGATRVGGSGVLQFFADSASAVANEDLAVLMVTLSDNTATNLLIDRVGMDAVNRTLSSLGLRETKLQRMMIRPEASARGEENVSTPEEAAALMVRLARCELPITRAHCERMRQLLELPKDEPVRSVIPANVRVASKPGTLEGVSTSWALVALPDRPFVLTVMTSYGDGQGDDAIRAVARASYAYAYRLARATPYGTRVPLEVIQRERAPAKGP